MAAPRLHRYRQIAGLGLSAAVCGLAACGPSKGTGGDVDPQPCTSDEDCPGQRACIPAPDGGGGMCEPSDGPGTDGSTDAGDEGGGDGDGDGDGEAITDIDVLFVVDNTGSMGDEQGGLATAVEDFVERLDASTLSYRIGFTTSDMGNVECAGTSPEGGRMRTEACTVRADEFTWPKLNPTVMAYDVACASGCPESVGNAIAIEATTTHEDAVPAPRPWIERIDGETNVSGATMAEAAACIAPQGVDGCGFESQLDGMARAVERMIEPIDLQYGFWRPEAALVVVIVTDEADCSANPAHQAMVFDRNLDDAAKVFWEDPTSSVPTSAICWNAGTSCLGGDPIAGYDDCRPADWDVIGDATADPEAAVLFPVSRYVDGLASLVATREAAGARAEIFVEVVAGVPEGYATRTSELVYAESEDDSQSRNFGIDWGCQGLSADAELQTAVPPVRLRTFAEAMALGVRADERNVSSMCEADFDGGLDRLLDRIEAFGND